ncbi:hypothetical protein ACS0TY_027090 [Phlomoides rotata]
MSETLQATMSDYYYDDCWYFEEDFFLNFTDIVIDIIISQIVQGEDTRIWPLSYSGELTSKAAYGFLKSSLPQRIGIFGPSMRALCFTDVDDLEHIFSRCSFTRQIPPDPGQYKVNIDGSTLFSPGWIYAGGIFRNSRGFFIAAFTKPVGWGFPLEAELAAGLLDIRHAHRLGWNNLWIELYSILVVRALLLLLESISWRL